MTYYIFLPAGDDSVYFGSVRFFKNLILLVVSLMVLIPTVLAIKYYHRAEHLDDLLKQAEAFAAEAATQAQDEQPLSESEPQTEFVPASDELFESMLTLDAPAYEQLFPDFVAPQPYMATERRENTVYLTFDDGPSDRTDEILNVLDEKNVKATFFVIGQDEQNAEQNVERIRKISEAGHTVGMHSFSHVYSSVYASVDGFLDEFYRNFSQIREITGVAPTVFRFPGGSINGYNGGFYQELISEMIRRGFVPFDWNVSSEDATGERVSADWIVDHVSQGVSGKVRAFILFHDSEPKVSTVQALGPLIDRIREMGYEFEPITPSTLPVLYNYR